MTIHVTWDTGEVQGFAFSADGENVFEKIQTLVDFIEDIRTQQTNRKIRLVEVAFEVGGISQESAKYLRNRLEVQLRRVNKDTTQVIATCKPENIPNMMLAVYSAVDVGEKLERLNHLKSISLLTDAAAKAKAQQNVKTGAIRPDCPLVLYITKLNGLPVTEDNIIRIRMQLEKLPDRKDILLLAYKELFKEEYPDPKKDTGVKDLFLSSDDDFAKLAEMWKVK